jgi:purine catabolism regulator
MLNVQALLDEVGLELVAGQASADAPIRWVHISELPDPTPWLSGGELLLTTGLRLKDESEQRDYVRRLVDHHLAGLGFGTGLEHDEIPAAVREEAEALEFPLFEVPYAMPFIAITEKAFTHLVNEQYEILQRGIALQRRLEQLVLEERGIDEVARALSASIGGAVLILDAQCDVLASATFRRELPAAVLKALALEVADRSARDGARPFEPAHEPVAGRALALPVAPDSRRGPQAWLIAARDAGGLGEFERLILQQAVTVIALELMRRRVVRDTERRLAGDVLAEAVDGNLSEQELRHRLLPFGVGPTAAVLVFKVDAPLEAEGRLERALLDMGVQCLVASREGLLVAVVQPPDDEPAVLAARARDALLDSSPEVRVATSRVSPLASLRRGYHEARYALEVAAMANGTAPDVASWRDLGAFQFLLSVQDDEALELYCDSVLGQLERGEGDYGGELLRSLEAFLEHNGQWEKAARDLFCHRHTLRYRIKRIEQLTGRDLGSARDRIEFWLALRARELVR